MSELDQLDRNIVNALQGGFPLCDEPYRVVADSLGIDEAQLIERLTCMIDTGALTRFGPMFQIEAIGGAFLLGALAVPDSRFDEVTALVNSLSEVAHNYRREHALNMWFVLATETVDEVAQTIARIEQSTGLTVYAFPKQREFFVEMKLAA